jgi:hypothetical protein
VSIIVDGMNLSAPERHEIDEMKQRVAPEAVLDAIEETEPEMR